MSKILCPVDFSNSSLVAIEYAATLAKIVGAGILLLHVEPEYMVSLKEGDNKKGIEGSIEGRLKEIAQQVQQEFQMPCEYRFDFADLALDVNEIASSPDVGLIVMGTNGTSDLAEYYLGSTTYQVSKQTNCSLLSIPENTTVRPPSELVFAVEQPTEGHERILDVITFARTFDANITILHVDKKDEQNYIDDEFKNKLLGTLENTEWINFVELEENDVPLQIRNFMNNKPNSVLAVLTHDLPTWQKLFHNSLTKEMLELAEFPVLVFH